MLRFTRTFTTNDLNNLQNILRSYPKQAQPTTSRSSQILWKPFVEHSFIRPHQLSYNSRLRGTLKPFKRPTVGPGASQARRSDVFYQLGINPLSECQNPALLAGFMSEMGKIYGREVTGLTVKNQRRLGKAVRRARMMGIIPILSIPPKSR